MVLGVMQTGGSCADVVTMEEVVVGAGAVAGGAATGVSLVLAAGADATTAVEAAMKGTTVSATMEALSCAPRAACVGNPHLICIWQQPS
jgi:hypothetical protein